VIKKSLKRKIKRIIIQMLKAISRVIETEIIQIFGITDIKEINLKNSKRIEISSLLLLVIFILLR
jgi:hypothetical protein